MTTWKLWMMLRNPPFSHPLFRRTLTNRMSPPARYEPPEYPIINARVIIEMLASLFICSSMFSPIFMLLAFVGLLLLMNGTVYSTIWAVRTSGIIAGARENQTYDLFCLAPAGALGANLAICTGFLHRNNRLEQIHGLLRSLVVVALVIVGIIAFILLSNAASGQITASAREEVQRSSLMLVHVLAVLALIYTDHIHSVVMGCMVSMLVPTYTRGRIDAQIGTFGVYLVLQVASYLIAWVVALNLLPSLFADDSNLVVQILLALLQIIVFYSIRETIISLLWQLLLRRLDVTTTEQTTSPTPEFKLGFKPR